MEEYTSTRRQLCLEDLINKQIVSAVEETIGKCSKSLI